MNLSELQVYLDRYIVSRLQEKCGDLFTIRIEESPTNMYLETPIDEFECVLKLYKHERVVSTLEMRLYLTDSRHFDITIESDTVQGQRQKKYNTLLRYVGLLLATKFRLGHRRASSVTSFAVSWISVYLLHHIGFHATSILTRDGQQLPQDLLHLVQSEFGDKTFLSSKLSQGRQAAAGQLSEWVLVKMVLPMNDQSHRRLIRRRIHSQLQELIADKIRCA